MSFIDNDRLFADFFGAPQCMKRQCLHERHIGRLIRPLERLRDPMWAKSCVVRLSASIKIAFPLHGADRRGPWEYSGLVKIRAKKYEVQECDGLGVGRFVPGSLNVPRRFYYVFFVP